LIAPPAVELRNVADACLLVDDLGASATGEIVVCVSDHPRGAVFVERGRVCWAAARGLSRRLSEILGARAALARGEMESHYAACKTHQIPLGEHLVGRGVLAAKDLRDALLEHTIESLRCLCTEDARAAWWPRSDKGYSPRFTFDTAELLARHGATAFEEHAAAAQPELDACFGEDDWAAAFLRREGSGAPQPIALRGVAPHTATALIRLGRWAASALDVAVSVSGDDVLVAVSRAAGDDAPAVVAFRRAGTLIVGETGAHGAARILNRRAERARKNADADL
jgi:hypothetical protein